MTDGTKPIFAYGRVRTNVYPVTERELQSLRRSAWLALTIVGIPLLIVEVLCFVRRLKRETQFDEQP